MPQASKYAEDTELQETEIDAAGIKIHAKSRVKRIEIGNVGASILISKIPCFPCIP